MRSIKYEYVTFFNETIMIKKIITNDEHVI